jgi:hypothetical protein
MLHFLIHGHLKMIHQDNRFVDDLQLRTTNRNGKGSKKKKKENHFELKKMTVVETIPIESSVSYSDSSSGPS